jgi:hypothetical protein
MKNDFIDNATTSLDGHVLVKDMDSGEVLLDKHNAINYLNVAIAVASLFAGRTDEQTGTGYGIAKIAYGNGGSIVDETTGSIQYLAPNTNTTTGQLHNKTYEKSVANVDTENKIDVQFFENQPYSDIIITSTLDYSEPNDQQDLDNAIAFEDNYVFDEIGLITDSGLYLTHLTFHPIQKSANRKIQIIYTLRIKAGG